MIEEPTGRRRRSDAEKARIVAESLLPGRHPLALDHWPGLTRFLDDGRPLELDTNPIENAIRPVAQTRKNALFAGHEVGAENWALLASLVATCKLNRVDAVAWIAATLQAILDGHPQSRIEDLMPWRFPLRQTPPHRGSAGRLPSSGRRPAAPSGAGRAASAWRSGRSA